MNFVHITLAHDNRTAFSCNKTKWNIRLSTTTDGYSNNTTVNSV